MNAVLLEKQRLSNPPSHSYSPTLATSQQTGRERWPATKPPSKRRPVPWWSPEGSYKGLRWSWRWASSSQSDGGGSDPAPEPARPPLQFLLPNHQLSLSISSPPEVSSSDKDTTATAERERTRSRIRITAVTAKQEHYGDQGATGAADLEDRPQ